VWHESSPLPTAAQRTPPSGLRRWWPLAGFLILAFSAAGIGRLAAPFAPASEWYAGLNKPTFQPPAWIFGPVWTVLYLLMGTAAWLVWLRGGWCGALTLFLVQLALNAAWTPLFFGLHEIGLALVDLCLLWAAVAAMTAAFYRVWPLAGALLVPYLAWVSFAAVLNAVLWRLN